MKLMQTAMLGFSLVVFLQAKDPQINSGNGLMGHYYQSYARDTAGVIIFNGLTEAFTRIDTTIDFWDRGGYDRWQPVAGYGDHYSVRWTGYIYIETTGAYGFGTMSDDGSQIMIDSTLIVKNYEEQWYDWEDNMGEGDTSNTPFTPLVLDSGFHEIEIGFYEDRYYDGIELWWFKPSADTSDIPYYGKNFSQDPPTYNPNTTWEIIPKSVLYSSLDIVNKIYITDREKKIPGSFELYQNHPNPFNPVTKISYELSESSQITLRVYDVLGKEIQTLVQDFQTAGSYLYEFNGSNLVSGIYFYELRTGSKCIKTRKMLLVR